MKWLLRGLKSPHMNTIQFDTEFTRVSAFQSHPIDAILKLSGDPSMQKYTNTYTILIIMVHKAIKITL